MSCEVINRVLFHEYGFRGARENFENPENSFLHHRVLDRREGLPITLCAIYMLIARRIGFELDHIGTPGVLWLVVLPSVILFISIAGQEAD